MRKLTTRQQQNNINCDESESECNGERNRTNILIEGNEQLTAVSKNELHRCRDGSQFIIQFSQSATLSNCKNLFRVF